MNEIRIERRSTPDHLRYLVGKLREGDRWREPVALALDVMADETSEASRELLAGAVAAFRQAMADEEVPAGTISRVLNRVLLGDPGGPGALYETRPDGSTVVHMGRMPRQVVR